MASQLCVLRDFVVKLLVLGGLSLWKDFRLNGDLGPVLRRALVAEW